MAAETGDPAVAAQQPAQPQQEEQKPAAATQPEPQTKGEETAPTAAPAPAAAAPAAAAPAAKAADAPPAEKKLTNAELKKKAKEEKAARRAQAKATQAPGAPAGGPQQGSAGGAKGGKGGSKQDGSAASKLAIRPAAGAAGSGGAPAAPKESKPAIPECFSHLPVARRLQLTQADKDVHPAVLMVGQHMATFNVSDSTMRVEITLLAFKKVISSYTTPQGTTFSRHFTSHVLNPQIEYLTACRPMCYSMGNAVRWLKLQISKVDIDLADFEARKILCETIDVFIRDRIRFARPLISGSAVDNMSEDEVIVTYGHHRLVEHALAWAKHQGRNYAITVVDDPFDRTGLAFAKRLSAMGYDRVTYAADLGVLNSHLRDATCVLVGAESVFSNGALYARAGTCDVAIAAKEMGVGLTALCEAINFTDRVSVDSLTYNEIDPERCTEDDFRLLFDTTKPEYISSLVNELGYATSSSVASLLRKLEVL